MDGQRAFVKAINLETDSFASSLYTRERYFAERIPSNFPAPRFLGEVRASAWLALVFEDIMGRVVPVPWSDNDLTAVLNHMDACSSLMTPCPIPGLESWGGDFALWQGWNWMESQGALPAETPAEARPHLRLLARLEAVFPTAAGGDTLLHSDLRSDNIILGADGSVTFVDWAHAARGAAWIDPLIFALCAAVQGHGNPQEILERHPAGQNADSDGVDSALAALAGRFVASSTRPGPAALRRFQRLEALACLRWLGSRVGW
ncbi:phosphotransferase [Nocardiopsis sp. NPDC007018]|uniref:phosphotransferase n=1 Tax=Nocardiopsis sp. NPDC007018 TaxID=3155721 RepID=UPI0033D699EB